MADTENKGIHTAVPDAKVNRNYKDRLFVRIFGNEEHKKWALNLFNALEETDYTNPDDLEIVTLDNAVYMHMNNDAAVLINLMHLSFWEHQSTLNPNIPYRMLEYSANTLSKLVDRIYTADIYSRRPIILPEPKFYVFYNGTDPAPKTSILKLSDLYYNKPEKPMLELIVKQININGYQGASVQLREYEWFIETIRTNRRTMSIGLAVNTALDTMPESFTIREFLLENRSEVLSMSIFTYNEEAHMKNERKEGYEDGYGNGYGEGQISAASNMLSQFM